MTKQDFEAGWKEIAGRYPNKFSDPKEARKAFNELESFGKKARAQGYKIPENDPYYSSLHSIGSHMEGNVTGKEGLEGHSDSRDGKAWYDHVFKEFEARKGEVR